MALCLGLFVIFWVFKSRRFVLSHKIPNKTHVFQKRLIYLLKPDLSLFIKHALFQSKCVLSTANRRLPRVTADRRLLQGKLFLILKNTRLKIKIWYTQKDVVWLINVFCEFLETKPYRTIPKSWQNVGSRPKACIFCKNVQMWSCPNPSRKTNPYWMGPLALFP